MGTATQQRRISAQAAAVYAAKVQSLLDKEFDSLSFEDRESLLKFSNIAGSSYVQISKLLNKREALSAGERAQWLAFRACVALRLASLETQKPAMGQAAAAAAAGS